MKRVAFVIFSISFLLVSILSIFGFSSLAHAQFNQIPQSQINVEMSPENPGPNQLVEVSLTSYDTNINEAFITWTVNGQIKKSGKGEKRFSFTSGNMNVTTTLSVTVKTSLGEVINQTIKIRPVSVDMLWQSDSFVPPFYKGKALFSYQNKITFIALPHITGSGGGEISSKNLIYTWSLNGSVIDDASGISKNTYTIVGSIIARPLDVSVQVSGGDSVGIASINVRPVDPPIIFYKKSPLYGIEFQKALEGTVTLTDSKEVTVMGMPYFFGVTNPASAQLSYKWAINSAPITTNYNSNIQVFRQKEGTSGESSISLQVENSSKILQSASNRFNLKFTDSPSAQTTI